MLGIAAVVLGGLWLQQHADDPDQGLKENIQNALKQLEDLKTNSWYESDVDETVQNEVDQLANKLKAFAPHAEAFLKLMDTTYKPASLDDKKEIDKMTDSFPEGAHQVVEDFVRSVKELVPSVVEDINKFSDKDYQLTHTKPSWIGNVGGRLGDWMHGRWGLIANDFISVVNALNPLKESLMRYYQRAQHFDEMKGRFQEKVEKTTGESGSGEEKKDSGGGGFWDAIKGFLGHSPSKDELEFFKSLEKE